jgi:WD40 repeat protein
VGDDGKIKLWDASTGQEILTLRGHTAQTKCVAWNTDGSLLATGDASGAVKLWNPAKTQESIVLKGRYVATWSPDGTRLATGGQELGSVDPDSPDKRGKIDIYDTKSWNPVATIEDQFFGATHGHGASWSPEGRRLAMCGRDGKVKVWEIPSLRELLSVTAHTKGIRSVVWSPDGQLLATAGRDKLVKIWDVISGKQVASLAGHTSPVGSVAFSPDGLSLASKSMNREVKIWDVVTWRELRQLHSRSFESSKPTLSYLDLIGDSAVSWSPSGDRLAAGIGPVWLIVWDTNSGREVLSFKAHVANVNCVSWSPDGRRLATGSSDRSVKVWDAENGRKLLTLLGHKQRLNSVLWSPDGRQLASGSRDGIRVWGPAKDEVHP